MAIDRRIHQHLETARARAAMSGRPVMATVARPAPTSGDPLGLIIKDTESFAWFQPDLGISICTNGAAATISPPQDDSRFRSAADALRDLRLRTMPLSLDAADRQPVLVGGFSFGVHSEWEHFPQSMLVLPAVAYVRRSGDARWISATPVGGDDDIDLLAIDIERRLTTAEDGLFPRDLAAGALDHDRAAEIELRDDGYVKRVAEAVGHIAESELSKVVVARELVVEHHPDPLRLLSRLRRRYPSCATFGFRGGATWLFCGATPERLVEVEGVRVSTAAVAGTAPRGIDATQDEVIADRLRHDPKELEEHRYVVEDIERRLRRNRVALNPTPGTEIMRLPGIQHLHTPISGTAPVGTNLIDLVGELHPTPAVGGLPADLAAAWIRDHERLERGWYAGPIGYTDLAGNGEFRVALRSALIENPDCRLFAGAGIVASSNPERELEETGLKLGALLAPVLGA